MPSSGLTVRTSTTQHLNVDSCNTMRACTTDDEMAHARATCASPPGLAPPDASNTRAASKPPASVSLRPETFARERIQSLASYPYLGIQWGTHASPARAHAFLSVLPRRRLQQHPYLERVFAGFEFSVSFSVRVPPPGRPLADSIQRRVLRNVGESVPKTTLLSQATGVWTGPWNPGHGLPGQTPKSGRHASLVAQTATTRGRTARDEASRDTETGHLMRARTPIAALLWIGRHARLPARLAASPARRGAAVVPCRPLCSRRGRREPASSRACRVLVCPPRRTVNSFERPPTIVRTPYVAEVSPPRCQAKQRHAQANKDPYHSITGPQRQTAVGSLIVCATRDDGLARPPVDQRIGSRIKAQKTKAIMYKWSPRVVDKARSMCEESERPDEERPILNVSVPSWRTTLPPPASLPRLRCTNATQARTRRLAFPISHLQICISATPPGLSRSVSGKNTPWLGVASTAHDPALPLWQRW
ncbi:hypothetical protein Purlil1_4397 [Purpureocillium lilacinum]|uniref:Uncharacterized protein n=1 Tax=Purpureocillium lilacinum TaxID=33203 RepID=A0ABR0C6M6_PURLI|nr:hypothetical protein Purlil1_4397 [Purpureocillium lilacinum]